MEVKVGIGATSTCDRAGKSVEFNAGMAIELGAMI